MTVFECWVKGCEETGVEIMKLGEKNDCFLFKTVSRYEQQNNFYQNPPVFHVWAHGKSICSTTNYTEGCGVWARVARE